jgi:hypothetical protein
VRFEEKGEMARWENAADATSLSWMRKNGIIGPDQYGLFKFFNSFKEMLLY